MATRRKPNILILRGDDIGFHDVSAYNQGMMGYTMPSIDSVAKKGALFPDWCGQHSCTAGRGSFITTPGGFRTDRALLPRCNVDADSREAFAHSLDPA